MGFTRTPFGNVYVVSDGMGGYRGGALAAELTVSTLQDRLAALAPDPASFPERMREAFAAANQAVFERRRVDDPDTCNMGATGVVLVTAGPRALVGHVGDSRAYLVQHRGRSLRQLTRDHTRVQKMVEAGMLTSAQAAEHPDASVLDRAIGHLPTVEVDVSGWIELKPRDMILLCSDGLSGYVDDAEIGKIVHSRGSPQDLADRLVELALRKGGEDNVTVQLVRFGRSAGAPLWKRLGQPALVAPATMLASVAVVWKVASSYLEDAEVRIAKLEGQLEETRRERGDLQARVQDLNARLQSRAEAQRKADAQNGPDAHAVQPAPAPPSPPPAAAAPRPATPPAPATRTPAKQPAAKARPARKTGSTATPARPASGPARAAPAARVSTAASAPAASAPVPSPSQASAPEAAPAAPAAPASPAAAPSPAPASAPAPATQASAPAAPQPEDVGP